MRAREPKLQTESVTPSKTVLVAGHDLKFAKGIIDELERRGHNVLIDRWLDHNKHDAEHSRALLQDADVVFCEWALGNALWFASNKLPHQRLVTRVHSQELFRPFLKDIPYKNVDSVIFVGQHIADIAVRDHSVPRNKSIVVPNPVDTDVPQAAKTDDVRFHIGLVGIVPAQKHVDRALDVLKALRAVEPRYQLFIKGKRPEDFAWMANRPAEMRYYEQQYDRINSDPDLAGAVTFDPHGDDMADWYQKIGIVLSVSDFESFHLTLADGAAAGAMPVSLAWPGSDQIYPTSWLAASVPDMVQKIASANSSSESWREAALLAKSFVEGRFNKPRSSRRSAKRYWEQRRELTVDASLATEHIVAQSLLARSFEAAVRDGLGPVASLGETSGPSVIAVESGNGLSVGCHVASEDPWGLKIAVPSGVRVVAHGHSVAFWCEAVQVAELHVQSTLAATVAVSETSLPSQRIELRGRGGELRIDLRFEKFLLKDRGVGRPGLGWRRHDSERSLNYILDSPVTGQSPRKLLVLFSAIGAEYDFTFNYRASVKGNTIAKAFVVDDFGSQGSYYWLDRGDDSIFHETQRLLAKLVDELGVDLNDVMFAGSSKGGTAALLHGVTLGVGRVLLGAPQYRVGDYLFKAAPRILDFMAGNASDESRQSLNHRAKEILVRGQRRTSIRVAVGSRDHHLKSHVRPLTEEALAAGYAVSSLILPGVPHSKIGWVFKHLLAAEALDLENGAWQEPLPYSFTRTREKVTLRCWPAEGEKLAVHLSGKKSVLERRPYSGEVEFSFVVSPNDGHVRARVFRRQDADTSIEAFTTHWA